MKVWLLSLFCVCSLPLLFAEEASEFEKITGLKGTFNPSEKVFKASFPRTDVKVTVDSRLLNPFMGLTSWAAFFPAKDNQFLVMGDLVLFEDEVNSVMSTLFENHLDVTALHNHFFFDQPRVYFMHIEGIGSLQVLSEGVKMALKKSEEIRMAHPTINLQFDHPATTSSNAISVKPLESIFGVQGQAKEGMVKFTFGRKVQVQGVPVGQEMGINTWAAFGGTDENAFVDGDFAVTEAELQPVLRTLRKGNIQIVAIHNHMTGENPRLIFLHFWANGSAKDLAGTIKEALKLTKS